MKVSALLFICLLSTTALRGQQAVVSGVVTSTNGETLPGVTVMVKNTSTGTVTDVNGNYRIEVSSENAVLSFSFVGFETLEREVGGQSIINVSLRTDLQELDEVIVVGYGTIRKSDLTGSVAKVEAEKIKDMPVIGLDQALQGRAAGVQVTNNSGAPGSGVSVRIRGIGSINSSSEPLYIIDGMPLNNSEITNPTTGASGDAINPMANINPDDIESIEILKDPSSTSIYGARGANGVVLITTKKGKEGTSSVEVSSFYGISRINKTLDLLNSRQFQQYTYEGLRDTRTPEGNPVYISDEEVARYDTDWQDEIFRTASTYNFNVKALGGSERTKYMMSAGLYDTEGILINTGFRRYSFRSNIETQLSKKLSVGININPSLTKGKRQRNSTSAASTEQNKTEGGPIVMTALLSSPVYPVYDSLGNYAWDPRNGRAVPNPVMLANEFNMGYDSYRTIGNAFLKWEPLEGLMFHANLGADIRNTKEGLFIAPILFPQMFWSNPDQPENYPASARASELNNQSRLLNFSQTVNYHFNIASDHHLTVLGGFEIQEGRVEQTYVVKSGYQNGKVPSFNAGTVNLLTQNGLNEWSFVSLFSRINYSFKGKYLLQLNGRYDASSRFGPNTRWGFFPAASAGWNIAEESLMKNVTFLEELKLRASVGLTGNSDVGNYSWRGSMILGTINDPSVMTVSDVDGEVLNYLGRVGGRYTQISNGDFSWEEHMQTNLGVDISLFRGRLSVSADVYRKNINDVLLQVQLPITTGINQSFANAGKLRNSGYEVSLTSYNISNNSFSWTTSFNIAGNNMEVVALYQDSLNVSGQHILVEGQPLQFYTYKRNPLVDPVTGWVTLQDLNEDGVISYGGGRQDRTFTGSPLPDFFGGITNSFKIKGFDLTVFLQYSYGNMIYNATRQALEDLQRPPGFRVGGNTSESAFENRFLRNDVLDEDGKVWFEENTETSSPATNWNGTSIGQREGHDGWIEDGSYLRLKTLTFGYTLPGGLLDKLNISSCRFYFTSNNLLTWTNYSGFDPEVSTVTGSAVQVGVDAGAYPQSKTYTLGFNLKF